MHGEIPTDEASLEEVLSEPDDDTVQALQKLDGDIIVLGAGGKMGPTVARMARRACDVSGAATRRVIAVSRFSNTLAAQHLESAGVEIVRADLSDPAQVRALPDAANVLWMAGQKFGTSGDPVGAWTHNVVAPTYAAERYAGARIVCFSTGNVYGRSDVDRGGSKESDPVIPDGEYAASCIGRERVFESVAHRTGSPLFIYRLFYACDLRYGVITDLALRVFNRHPIALSTAWVNVIWQGDANRLALRALGAAAKPAHIVNVTGPIVGIEWLANELGRRLDREPVFDSTPSPQALVANIDALDRLLPYQPLPLDDLLDWTAQWIRTGQPLLGKPTKYEVRDGRF